MCVRWVYSSFVSVPNSMTRGRRSFVKTVELEDGDLSGVRVRVHLHDIATIADMKTFRCRCHGAFILYNTQDESSFASVERWLDAKQNMLGTFVLIGAQADDSG